VRPLIDSVRVRRASTDATERLLTMRMRFPRPTGAGAGEASQGGVVQQAGHVE
jgi:hypothetical protein